MPLHKMKQLPDLIRLGLPTNFLKVHEFGDRGVDEDVMAASYAREMKAERLGEGAGLGETEVMRCVQSTLKKLSRIHERDSAISGFDLALAGAVLLRLTIWTSGARGVSRGAADVASPLQGRVRCPVTDLALYSKATT
jgi:hypothetical protein